MPILDPLLLPPLRQREKKRNLDVNLNLVYLAGRGCDGMLYNLINALLEAGILSVPQAGQTLNGGEILLKR